jgi:hypothetical protein
LCFGFDPSLELGMDILRRVEQFLDARKRAAGRCGAGFDGLVGTIKIIPGERLDVGAENQVGVTLPYLELMLLGGADGAADDLKDVGWSAAVTVIEANRNGQHKPSTKLAGGGCGNLGDQTTIGEPTRSNLHGFEQARESAACADRLAQISVGENYGLSVGQVRRDYSCGNLEVLELARFEHLLDQIAQAVIAGEPQPGNAPPGDVPETERAASSNDARERRAAGIGRPENAAHARASDIRNWNVILLENLQDAEMGESPGESAAQSQA